MKDRGAVASRQTITTCVTHPCQHRLPCHSTNHPTCFFISHSATRKAFSRLCCRVCWDVPGENFSAVASTLSIITAHERRACSNSSRVNVSVPPGQGFINAEAMCSIFRLSPSIVCCQVPGASFCRAFSDLLMSEAIGRCASRISVGVMSVVMALRPHGASPRPPGPVDQDRPAFRALVARSFIRALDDLFLARIILSAEPQVLAGKPEQQETEERAADTGGSPNHVTIAVWTFYRHSPPYMANTARCHHFPARSTIRSSAGVYPGYLFTQPEHHRLHRYRYRYRYRNRFPSRPPHTHPEPCRLFIRQDSEDGRCSWSCDWWEKRISPGTGW